MSSFLKLASLLIAFMVVASPAAEAALTCSQVTGSLAPCIPYLRNGGGAVPAACCSGIKSLVASAKTTADRQAACQCMKAAASGMPGINPALATGLPGKCGANIPYKISPTTDCKNVK
ncbi:non-specific lipid-transfer protein 1-like [Punica granatum]|uniref:Non-specific lipid-transfer protein n=2 Tax=Punica granatum TaxID=22663 RepID=A0A2I0I233_PUNGR|nr:non-specific lipid-transfer protein 1-like [Punica granatum]PKI38002.1 hypothetical protein CRG98_041598 [Punica granatum]